MTNAQVTQLGGNQYKVTINNKTQKVDLDGFTIMSDEDMEKVEKAGLVQADMMCPRDSELSGDDPYFKAAVEHAANYSGFIAEKYITNSQE